MSTLGKSWSEAQCGTEAAYKRHQRRREPPCYSCLQANARSHADRVGGDYRGPSTPDTRQVRNGLPGFRPYVYRGTGADTLTGCPVGYGNGCRCEDCREQHAQRQAKVRAELAERPRDQVPHGVGGYRNWGCRCEICTAAHASACMQGRSLRRAS